MRKLIFTLSIMMLGMQAFSQTFSVELSGQYGTAIFGHLEPQSQVYRYSLALDRSAIWEKEFGVFTLGDGYQFNLTLNAKLADNFYFRLKNSYFATTNDNASIVKYAYAAGDRIDTYNGNGNAYLFAPMLMFQSEQETAIQPYIAMGVVGGILNYQQDESSVFLEDIYSSTREFTTPFALGFQGQIGASYSINEKLSIRIGLDCRVINFHPTSAVVTTHTLNGEDKLSELTTYQRESVYGDQFLYYDIDNDDHWVLNIDDNEPRNAAIFPVPLSSLALEIGVQYRF